MSSFFHHAAMWTCAGLCGWIVAGGVWGALALPAGMLIGAMIARGGAS